MFSYKVKDLYIGTLGYVKKDLEGNLTIEQKKQIIIYKKINVYNEYCAREIFTNQKYYFFYGKISKINLSRMYKQINELAIYLSIPLSIIIYNKRITKKALEELYNGINREIKQIAEEKVEEPSLPITDSILQMILDTSKKIKGANIDEYLKEEALKSLENLSEFYVQKIINKIEAKDDNNLELTTENEYTIKMEIMKKLVEIEQNYQNPENIKKYNLKRQLIQVKRKIN